MMKCERGRVKCDDVCWCLLFLMNFFFLLHQEEEALDLSGVKFWLLFCLFGFLSHFLSPGSNTFLPGYDMSPFIRRYAKYLGEKSTAYRGTAMDFCKVKRGLVLSI